MSVKPDYILKGLNKNTGAKGLLGAAWKKSDGSIAIALNPFMAILIGEAMVLTLFPNNRNDDSEAIEPDEATDGSNVVPWGK